MCSFNAYAMVHGLCIGFKIPPKGGIPRINWVLYLSTPNDTLSLAYLGGAPYSPSQARTNQYLNEQGSSQKTHLCYGVYNQERPYIKVIDHNEFQEPCNPLGYILEQRGNTIAQGMQQQEQQRQIPAQELPLINVQHPKVPKVPENSLVMETGWFAVTCSIFKRSN